MPVLLLRLAQIVRTGWFKPVQIKSHKSYVNRALLTVRNKLVGIRVRLENEIRGLRIQPVVATPHFRKCK